MIFSIACLIRIGFALLCRTIDGAFEQATGHTGSVVENGTYSMQDVFKTVIVCQPIQMQWFPSSWLLLIG